MLMVLLAPVVLAFVFGWLAFRSRVTGVYLSIITQALTYALMLAFFRNEMGFGGNNGLTDFKDILGFSLQSEQYAHRTCCADRPESGGGYSAVPLDCQPQTGSGGGGDSRQRGKPCPFSGLPGGAFKVWVFTLSAMLAGWLGRLYVPQVGIINPGEFSPLNSMEIVIWVAIGGRGTLVWRGDRRGAGQLCQNRVDRR